MAADLPQNYEARPDVFRFIEDVPADWQDTQVLHARIGDYVTIVRKDRHGDDWYLGSITDEHGRCLTASLCFLDEGKTYLAQIYRDGNRADWKTNPLRLRHRGAPGAPGRHPAPCAWPQAAARPFASPPPRPKMWNGSRRCFKVFVHNRLKRKTATREGGGLGIT